MSTGRKQFEAWMRSQRRVHLNLHRAGGRYSAWATDWAWSVWQAASSPLQAQVEALEADARRYRWLKEEIAWLPPKWNGVEKGRHDWFWYNEESDLDAAIDAAMASAAKEG